MPAYQTDIDIINRGLQHLGRPRIVNRQQHSAEVSETDFAYDKLREAELNNNLWVFATKRVMLRPVTTSTALWTPAAWASGTTYGVGAVVTYQGQWWQSKIASNLGNAPLVLNSPGLYWRQYFGNDSLLAFDATLSYFAGELVSSGGAYYLSLVSGNLDNTPPSAGNWLLLGGTTAALQILYPIGSGPATDPSTRNVYRLPRGWLRMAPSNPKGNAAVWLGAPHGNVREDWIFESGYVITAQQNMLLLRYVADMMDVLDFNSLFCEMLAARIALECVMAIATIPTSEQPMLLRNIRSHYEDERNKATRINAIETGPIDPDVDDFITCRI
jgi:hypothetical protein